MGGWLDWLFPPTCAGCGARPVHGPFCRGCAAWLEPLPAWRCCVCAAPLPPVWGEAATGARRCGACRAQPPAFDRAIAPFLHGGAIADAVHRLKYRGRREVAGVLGPLLAVPAIALGLQPEVVAPVPLHRARRRERGYDQAELLAQAVARRLGVRCAPRLLERARPTPPQVGACRSERRHNLRGAFRAEACAGARVLLVDDVLTTGATASAAAAALREAGAREVTVLTLARAG